MTTSVICDGSFLCSRLKLCLALLQDSTRTFLFEHNDPMTAFVLCNAERELEEDLTTFRDPCTHVVYRSCHENYLSCRRGFRSKMLGWKPSPNCRSPLRAQMTARVCKTCPQMYDPFKLSRLPCSWRSRICSRRSRNSALLTSRYGTTEIA